MKCRQCRPYNDRYHHQAMLLSGPYSYIQDVSQDFLAFARSAWACSSFKCSCVASCSSAITSLITASCVVTCLACAISVLLGDCGMSASERRFTGATADFDSDARLRGISKRPAAASTSVATEADRFRCCN